MSRMIVKRAGLTLVVAMLAVSLAIGAWAQPRIGVPPLADPPAPPRPPPPPPSIGLTEPMWVAVNGQATGPFEPAVIAQKIAAREIIGETLVFTNSMNRWVRAADVAALQPLLRQAQAGGGAGGAPPAQPPLPPSGDREAIERLTQFMLGEWLVEAPGMYPGITVRNQTRYLPDGTFRGFIATIVTVGGQPGTATRPNNGRWTVQPLEERRFILTLTGSQTAGSFTLEILDPNRLRNFQDNYIAIRIAR